MSPLSLLPRCSLRWLTLYAFVGHSLIGLHGKQPPVYMWLSFGVMSTSIAPILVRHTVMCVRESTHFHVMYHCLLTMITMLRWKREDLEGGGCRKKVISSPLRSEGGLMSLLAAQPPLLLEPPCIKYIEHVTPGDEPLHQPVPTTLTHTFSCQ